MVGVERTWGLKSPWRTRGFHIPSVRSVRIEYSTMGHRRNNSKQSENFALRWQTMKIPLTSLGALDKVIIIACPNRWGLHEKVYIRYLLLIDSETHAIWLDDPSEQEVVDIVHRVPHEVHKEVIMAPCHWCQARDCTSPENTNS